MVRLGVLFHSSSQFLGAFAKSQNVTVRFVVSVRPPAWNNSARTGQIFIKFYIRGFF
jgi:hypothetical protein